MKLLSSLMAKSKSSTVILPVFMYVTILSYIAFSGLFILASVLIALICRANARISTPKYCSLRKSLKSLTASD